MYACPSCSSLGRKVERRQRASAPVVSKDSGPDMVLVSGFGEKIRHAREAKGLTAKEFAEKIFEKESFLHKVESGHRPSDDLAKKISSSLEIALFEKISVEKQSSKIPNEKMTLWDLAKKK